MPQSCCYVLLKQAEADTSYLILLYRKFDAEHRDAWGALKVADRPEEAVVPDQLSPDSSPRCCTRDLEKQYEPMVAGYWQEKKFPSVLWFLF